MAQNGFERGESHNLTEKTEPSAPSLDQMRQIYQQLSVLFTPNATKSSGIISNLSKKF
jgi:hypothetical protein